MENYLTKEGLEKLKKELEYLKTVKRKEVAENLRYAASFGDLSENFAYQQAKEDQAFLESRILELEEKIKNAKIIEKKLSNKVVIGSTVFLSLDGKKEQFQIVGPEEADPFQGKISYQSPLGKALLGKTIGQTVEVEVSERKIKYKIIDIK